MSAASAPNLSAAALRERNAAVDVFRGATVAFMILVNNPGSWSHLFAPLAHAPWHGCTPTDLVFPFFLFAVGNALAFVMPGLAAQAPATVCSRVARRTAWIFLIGLFLNASPFVRWGPDGELVLRSLGSLRFMGVLQRIALAWGVAALIVWAAGQRPRAVFAVLAASAALLLGYWAACLAFAQGADPYSLEGFFGTALDRALLGPAHLYKGEGVAFDPEGLASTVPAVAQVLLGWWVGLQVQPGVGAAADMRALCRRLLLQAAALLLLAALWQQALPINKKIWTSSYVLLTHGLATACLAALLWQPADRLQRAGWARFFDVFGKNALFVFVLSGFLPRLLALLRWSDGVTAEGKPRFISVLPWLYRSVFEPLAQAGMDPRVPSLLYACANLAAYWLLARWLHQRRIYIRV